MRWQRALRGLLSPERRAPPGRLSLPDLQRLVDAREEQHGLLLRLGKELLEDAPLLGRWSIARRLEAMAEQGRKAAEYLVMLCEVLPLYGDPEGVAKGVGLSVVWQEQAGEELKAMDLELQQAIVRSLPAGLLEASRGEVN